jgi:putative PIN family toxin of toxin-antitoxin system
MRVLIDTNVFISYLLSSHSSGVIQEIFSAWAEGRFILLVPEALLDEILLTVKSKSHLEKRIPADSLKILLATVQELSEEVPWIEGPIPAVTRDAKDDYLLAYALVGGADFLVSGDKDLLELQGQLQELEILTPRQFSEVLSLPSTRI